MGKFLNKFKKSTNRGRKKIERMNDDGTFDSENIDHNKFKKNREEEYSEDYGYDDYDSRLDDETPLQPAQKPESFHHFILENRFQSLERSVRGIKDVWDKKEQKWISKRKEHHCFTDEEAEDILRMIQSHLSTDIKLSFIKREVFGLHMNALYKEIAFLFESIAEYQYGRYGATKIQYEMKLQNSKIFLEVWANIQANYSRAIDGKENLLTHDSVKSQESLQGGDNDELENRRYT